MRILYSSVLALTMAACSPADKETSEPAKEAVTQETPMTYNETEMMAGKLAGTYLNAGDGSPVVVIVPGSGPTDRDGNSMAGMKSNALKFLAQGLAADGISSVRVDKRGMFASKDAGNGNDVSVDIYAGDYRAWATAAAETSGQSCVFLLGHSEGGLMISAAAKEQTNVCGVILVAAPGKPLGDLMRDQLKSNPANAPVLDDALGAITALEKGEDVDIENFHPALKGLFNPAIQPYLKSLFSVDPADVLKSVNAPALIVQGENDLQVPVEDAKRLAKAAGTEAVIIPGINHVLKTAPTERMANMMVYNSPTLDIDPAVTKAVASFIKSNAE